MAMMKGRTGSMPTTVQAGLCVFLIAREIPLMVPPVPAPATKTSTFVEEGCVGVDGVDTTASMISGPVVNSCAPGLLTCIGEYTISQWPIKHKLSGADITVLI